MKLLMRLAAVIAAVAFAVPAFGQSFSGQIGSGQVYGNSTAGAAKPQGSSLTSLFDRAYCNTVGYLIVRTTGAWTCSQSVALNPVWWGADPTGAADSAAAISAAVTAAPAAGCNISFPAGTFKLNGVIADSGKPCNFYGVSRQATILSVNFATGDAIVLTGVASRVHDLQVTNAVTRTSGAYVLQNQAYQDVSDVLMFGPYVGVSMQGTLTSVRNAIMRNLTPAATSAGSAGVVVGGASQTVSNVIDNLQMDNPAGSQPSYGIFTANSDNLFVQNSGIIHSGSDLGVIPNNGQVVASLNVVNTFFDTAVTGATISPAGTGTVLRTRFDTVWMSSNTQQGLVLTSTGTGAVAGFTCTNCHVFFNGADGVLINSSLVNSVIITESQIGQNGSNGINVAANTNKLMFAHNQIGAYAGANGNTTNGINFIAGTGAGIVVMGNALTGNATNIAGCNSLTGAGNYFFANSGDTVCGAWSTYTPTLTCAGAGAAPTTSAIAGRYRTIDKDTRFEITATLSSTGTCAAGLNFSLPNTAQSAVVVPGRETASTGLAMTGTIGAATSFLTALKYDNTVQQTNGNAFTFGGSYENQ